MADISKINGVPIANIEKLDAVLAANIAKVNGLVFSIAPAFTGLLDTYTGAAAGYSTRRLSTSATNLMRIREDAGDTETDIGYDSNNELDTAAIATHCGTANGFVVTWYDQASSNNATQSTTTSQPKIYDGTTQAVITENGKPVIEFVSLDELVTEPYNSGPSVTQPNTWFFTVNKPSHTSYLFDRYGSSGRQAQGNGTWIIANNLVNNFYPTADLNHQRLFTLLFNGSNSISRMNGTATGSGDPGTAGTTGIKLISSDLKVQEIVLYGADQTSNFTGIETNINSEFLIYQPTDAPTSGLLATYTGAAAAYSVRQLSDKAVIALRIRRDSDDEEINIGWDANGDLDTTAISDFCSTANGYVTRWWDQSTNGVHADQATDASQPQIYNGTAVITENGKAALQGGSGVYLTQPSAVSVPNDLTILAVADTSNLTTTQLILAIATATCVTGTQIFTDSNGSRINGRSSTCGFVHSTKSGNSSLFIGVLDYTNDSLTARYDGVAQSAVSGLTETPNSIDWNVGANVSGTSNNLGTYQEVVIWLTAQSPTNATNIESNVMTYFSIT